MDCIKDSDVETEQGRFGVSLSVSRCTDNTEIVVTVSVTSDSEVPTQCLLCLTLY